MFHKYSFYYFFHNISPIPKQNMFSQSFTSWVDIIVKSKEIGKEIQFFDL